MSLFFNINFWPLVEVFLYEYSFSGKNSPTLKSEIYQSLLVNFHKNIQMMNPQGCVYSCSRGLCVQLCVRWKNRQIGLGSFRTVLNSLVTTEMKATKNTSTALLFCLVQEDNNYVNY